MKRVILFFWIFVFSYFCACGDPIETPDEDESNIYAITPPGGWGCRTFKGKNGLIAVLWPYETNFNAANTAIFIFLQSNNKKLPKVPDNINLFTEKCPLANFKLALESDGVEEFALESDDVEEFTLESDDVEEDVEEETISLGKKYFTGRCGRTMIVFREKAGGCTIIALLVSAFYVSKKQLADTKAVVSAYKKEIEKTSRLRARV
ncbi:MAG: hypothetical protein LBB25_02970 [Holosporaceae bacterium]|nr:hypothetical protein [Holosporaceae bacterium]